MSRLFNLGARTKPAAAVLRWPVVCACMAAVLLASLPAQARHLAAKKQRARSEYERAEQLREALNGRPAKQRTRREYEKVINAYRQVYFTAPTSNKADASAQAVAELMAESARSFHNIKGFRDSIEQYQFLRREYPGSKYRMGALFSIGQIYREDLLDFMQARVAYQEFLKLYPHNHLAEQARAAITEMDAETNAAKKHTERNETAKDETAKNDASSGDDATGDNSPFSPTQQADTQTRHEATNVSVPTTPRRQRNQLTMVTGIRHWSTPDYTRIAIDIDHEVSYQAGRVPSPDRIFFDLDSTRLAPELSGKTFDVGEGFLKKIRVAQFKSNMTRVVLEVDQLADYSAFLLPNPYRLIIDVHGKQPATTIAKRKAEGQERENQTSATASPAQDQVAQNTASASVGHDTANSHEKSASSGSESAQDTTAARETKSSDIGAKHHDKSGEEAANASASHEHENDKQVADAGHEHASGGKNAVAEKSAQNSSPNSDDADQDLSLVDIAGLNNQPDEVSATSKPTNHPIAQMVSPREVESEKDKIASENVPSETTGKATGSDKIAGTHKSASSTTHKGRHAASTSTEVATSREAQPTADGDRSLIRALGLKIGKIVIDAGHGGHDTGTIGPTGYEEKDLVLDVALRLGKLLQQQLGAEIVYTRSDDTFVPLETRTAIANKAQADLFISVHANSSRDPSARGVETYYLNFTASPDAMEVAARENAVSEKSIHELQDLVKKIALKEKIEESREFAADVQESLYGGFASKAGMKNRGVKKAPFIVLIGANMPSILAEISFVSNPRDEKKLRTPEFREKIAESLAHGVEKYVAGLSGVKLTANAADAAQGGN